MNFNKKYHPKSFLPKLLMGKAWFALFGIPYRHNDLLVLNYHSTPEWLLPEFEKQVQFFSQYFNIVSPGILEDFYNGKVKRNINNKPSVLFTFDDGLKNNLGAAGILEKYSAHGLFFLVPAFFKLPEENQKAYYVKNIRRIVNYNIDTLSNDVTALSADDIRFMISKGHRMGCHSYTHTMHREDDQLKNDVEIIKSKKTIEDQFQVSVVDFCAPFDSLRSTDKRQMELIRKHYKFFHATFPGSNANQADPYFIRRTNVECWWPLDVIKFALSSFEWNRWRSKRDKFRKEVL